MRKGRRFSGKIGCLAIIAGILILLALILPPGFWWFALAIGLIIAGIYFLRSC